MLRKLRLRRKNGFLINKKRVKKITGKGSLTFLNTLMAPAHSSRYKKCNQKLYHIEYYYR